jgi:hypothetical protein
MSANVASQISGVQRMRIASLAAVVTALIAIAPLHAQGTGQGGCYFGQGPGCPQGTGPAAPKSFGLQCDQKSGSETHCRYVPAKSGVHTVTAKTTILNFTYEGLTKGISISVAGNPCLEQDGWRQSCYGAGTCGKRIPSEVDSWHCSVWLKGNNAVDIVAKNTTNGATHGGVTVAVTEGEHKQ